MKKYRVDFWPLARCVVSVSAPSEEEALSEALKQIGGWPNSGESTSLDGEDASKFVAWVREE